MFENLRVKVRNLNLILFQPLLKLKINPNLITFFSLIFVIFSFIYFNNYYLLVLFSVLHLVFDGLDGFLARELKMQSVFGKYFDFFVDRLYEFLMVIRFAYEGYLLLLLFLLVLFILNLFKEEYLHSRTVIVIGLVLGLYEITYYTVFVITLVSILLHFKKFYRRSINEN